jgi:cobalt/nickel transport system permease protein
MQLSTSNVQRPANLVGLVAASGFVLAAQMVNVPVWAGVSGHFLGGFVLAWWFGSAWGALAMSAVLIVQSLLLADGGLMALGWNILNMAIVPAVVAGLVRRRCRRGSSDSSMVAIGAGASVLVAACSCGVALLVSHGDARVLPTLLATHALVGVIEVVVTLAAVTMTLPMLRVGAVAAVFVAAVVGVSPWPDALEFSVNCHGLSALVTPIARSIESFQASLLLAIGPQQSLQLYVGCAATVLLLRTMGIALSRRLGKRGTHAAAS